MNFNTGKKFLIIGIIALSIGGALYTAGKTELTAAEGVVGAVITPLQKLAYGTKNKLAGIGDYFKGIAALRDENSTLKDELLLARAEANRLKNVESENAELYELMEMSDRYTNIPTQGAKIIARDTGSWNNTLIIDKGSNDGLKRNMPVLSGDGLVGKISKCGANYSQVVTITNDTDSVSVKSSRTNDVGYVTGDASGSGTCTISFSDESADFMIGDEIITSNLSSIYPEGITVGKITKLPDGSADGKNKAVVEPAADIKHIENVLILCSDFESGYDSIMSDFKDEAEAETEAETTTEEYIPSGKTFDPVSSLEQPEE